MAITSGYNPERVNRAVKGIVVGMEGYFEAMNRDMQDKFVKPMSSLWACEQAQRLFNSKYKPEMDKIYSSASNTLRNIIEHVNSAGVAYAKTTESEFSPISFEIPANACDVSIIVDNIGGDKGIDQAGANDTVKIIDSLVSRAESSLDSLRQSAAESGILSVGDSYQAALDSSVNSLKQQVVDFANALKAEFNALVQQTVEQYGSLESQAVDAASGSAGM